MGKYRNMPETLREAFVLAEKDTEMTSLREEIALLRGLLSEALTQYAQGEKVQPAQLRAIIKDIRETVGTMAAIEGKLGSYIPIHSVTILLDSLVEIIRAEVGDERVCAAISERMGGLPLERRGREAKAITQPATTREDHR